MFLVSTLYHAMDHDSPHKQVFRILDHIFIYFAIAGSYTPVALCLIKGYQGIIILVIQWAMVIVGILYKSISIKSLPKLSLTIYLVMGWTAILFMPSIIQNSSAAFLWLIVIGGLMYSIGAYFYANKKNTLQPCNLAYIYFNSFYLTFYCNSFLYLKGCLDDILF